MKLVGDLKKQVENSTSLEESRELIEKAGVSLTDDELEKVAGGIYCHLPDSDTEKKKGAR